MALAMACCAAIAHKGEIKRRQSSSFNPALHIARSSLRFKPGWPVFIGQTFINGCVTVIGQLLDNGQVNVLAALVSEGLSLKAHLEQHVRPWFSANIVEASYAATCRSPLLAALEDTDEIRAELGGLKTEAYRTLKGFFVFEENQLTAIRRPWEERRSVVMDILGRAMKFTFRPCISA